MSRNAEPFLHGYESAVMIEALHHGQYGHGETTEKFERALAEFLGVPDIVATSSCTAALQLALRIAGVGAGDEVVVPSQTFCATVQAIVACGARPRWVEVDPTTCCVRGQDVLAAVTPRTRVVLPVLYGGRAIDLRDIQDALDRRGIAVVEDAAHAFGSWLGDRRVGATGALTCFSFGPIKNLTCIEGGAVVPRDAADAADLRALRALGIVQPQAERIRSTTYTVDRAGLRATMSCVHAAVGLAQLAQFGAIELRRKALWRAYAQRLSALDEVTLVDVDIDRSVPFNCVVLVPRRDQVFAALRGQGIGVGVHYPPNHLQPAFAAWHHPLPVTEATAEQMMSLPFHPRMTDDDVDHVATALADTLATLRTPSGRRQP